MIATKSLEDILDDTFDSRDIIERIEELENALLQPGDDPVEGCQMGDDAEPAEANGLCYDHNDELQRLRAIAEEGSGYAEDWQYGAQFIRESYFTEYAQELAYDIGAIPEGGQWPTYCIDWEWAARELKMDYSAIDIDGVTYYVR